MKAETKLTNAALHFYGRFLENPAPSRRSRKDWNRLESIALRIYTRAGAVRPGDFESLRAILRDCRACLPLLTRLERVPLVHRAFLDLEWVASVVEECLFASTSRAPS